MLITLFLFQLFSQKEPLAELSCTDQTCSWKESHDKKIEDYEPAPLLKHKCFRDSSVNKRKAVTADGCQDQSNNKSSKDIRIDPDIDDSENVERIKIIKESLPSSAYCKHAYVSFICLSLLYH